MTTSYVDNTYHSSAHAADVLIAFTHLVTSVPALSDNLSDNDVLACMLAAISHDYQHPGCNNNLLIKSSHSLGMYGTVLCHD